MGRGYNGGHMAFLDIIIFLASVQLFILVGLVLATFLVKLRLEKQETIKQKRRALFKEALIHYPDISIDNLNELKKHLHMTFVVFLELEEVLPEKKRIVRDLFLPQIQQRAKARLWYDRYMAAGIIQYINIYHIEFDAQGILIQLLHDPVALVVISAFKAMTFKPDENLLNEVIEVFSKFRRSQLELMVSLLEGADLKLVDLIFQRLDQEKDPIYRAFCYRLLINLPVVSHSMPYLKDDIKHESLNLALASINYIFYSKKSSYKKMLIFLLQNDERWQVKDRCLKYLGQSKDPEMVNIIYPFIQDKVWWVRYRAANALSQLGVKGEQALQNAKLGLDEFAKDMATQRLEQYIIPYKERL